MTSDVVGFLLYYMFYLYSVKSDHSFLGQDWPGRIGFNLGLAVLWPSFSSKDEFKEKRLKVLAQRFLC